MFCTLVKPKKNNISQSIAFFDSRPKTASAPPRRFNLPIAGLPTWIPSAVATRYSLLVVRSLEAGNVRREVEVVNLLQQLAVAGYLWPTGHRRVRQRLFGFLRREAIPVGHDVELEPGNAGKNERKRRSEVKLF